MNIVGLLKNIPSALRAVFRPVLSLVSLAPRNSAFGFKQPLRVTS